MASAATAGCRVTYTVTNSWPGGFGTNMTIDNLGGPLTGATENAVQPNIVAAGYR